MNITKFIFWGNAVLACVSLLLFGFMAVIAGKTLWLNFVVIPNDLALQQPAAIRAFEEQQLRQEALQADQFDGSSMPSAEISLLDDIASFFLADRSGASAVCAALFVLFLSRYFYLRAILALHIALLGSKKTPSGTFAPDTLLPDDDPILDYISSKKTPDTLEKLERRLSNFYDIHWMVSPLVTLGLFGTLMGLWVGFVGALGGSIADNGLQQALQSAVIVVATAALSSITGIGLGQLIVEPLANKLDNKLQVLLTDEL